MLTKSYLQKKFTKVYNKNLFHGESSLSGQGSDLKQTETLRKNLKILLGKVEAKSLLDIPCGDFYWMSQVDLNEISYTGSDIVEGMVTKLSLEYQNSSRKFKVINLVSEVPPINDVIFCRDLFVHLSNKNIKKSLNNIVLSDSKYLFTTTFTRVERNKDLPIFRRGVKWRTLNLELPPWNFPKPIYLVNENCTEGNGAYADKSIAVWEIKNIPLNSINKRIDKLINFSKR
jgi:hypothetical protein